MSRRLRVALVLMVGIAAAAVITWWLAASSIGDKGRALLQGELARTLGMPVRLSGLTVAIAPPMVAVNDMAIGEDGGAVRVGRTTVRLMTTASLREFRPVIEAEIDHVRINPDRFSTPSGTGKAAAVPLPFRLRRLRVSDGRVQISAGDAPVVISFADLAGEIEAQVATRRIRTALQIDRLRLQRKNEALDVDSVRLTAAESGGGWVIGALKVDGDGLSAAGSGVAGPPIRHRLEMDVAVPLLRLLDEHLASVTGRLRLRATITGALAALDSAIAVTLIDPVIGGHAPGDIAADLEVHGRQVELVAGRLSGIQEPVTFDGSVTLSGAVPFRLNVDWKDVDVRRALAAATDATAAGVRTQGRISLSGTGSPLALEGRASGELVVSREEPPPIKWSAEGRYAGAGGRVELTIEQGAANRVRGDVTITAGGDLSGPVRAQIGDARALSQWLRGVRPAPVRGVLAATAEIGGTPTAPRLSGSVRAENVEVAGVILERVGGEFAVSPDTVRLRDAVIESGGGSLTAEGALALAGGGENAWDIVVRDMPVDVVTTVTRDLTGLSLPLQSGRVSATGVGRGSWSGGSTTARASVEGFHMWGEPFDRLSIEARAGWPRWNVKATLSHRPGEQLEATLDGSGMDSLRASVRGTEWSLEHLRGASSAGLEGVVTASAEVAGPWRQLGGHVAVGLAGLKWGQRSVERVTLSAEGDAGRWQVAGAVGEGMVAHGALVASGGFPLAARLEWQDTDYGLLTTGDAAVQIVSSGRAAVHVPLAALRDAGGEIEITALRVAYGGQEMVATRPVRIRGEHGRFSLGSLSFVGTNVQLDASGGLGTDGDVDLRLRADGDLAWLEVMSERVQSARGRVTVAADLRRSPDGRWDLAGDGSVEDAAVDLGGSLSFAGVRGRCTLDKSVIRIDQLRGDWAGGAFRVGGHVDLETGPALTWNVSEASPGLLENLETELSGSGSVAGRWDDFTVAGAIEISQALLDWRIGLADFIPRFGREVAPVGPRERTERTIRLDLRVTAPEIFVDSNVAKAELRADLRVGGTIEEVTLAGPIEVISGEVVLQGRKFVVERGVIEFRPALGLNPSLDITADSVVDTPGGTYTVSVQVVGTTKDYRVLLSSDDPSLSQTDLASLVSLGKTSAQLQQAGTGVSANDLIALAPRVYGDEIEQRVREVLPIDRMSVESAYSRTTGSFEPRLTIGKDLTDRLAALVSSTFGVENRRGVELDYRLTPRISLSGKWESDTEAQAGAFGGEVKFHYAFRRAPRFSLLAPWRGWSDGELW